MYFVVHHRVVDREKFLVTDPKDIGGNAPPGAQVFHFLPASDASAADCLWEADSLETLRDYERDHANRPRVVGAIESVLARRGSTV